MNILNKTIISLLITTTSFETFAAYEMAQAFSRANCISVMPFNESISYDLTTGIHYKMIVTTRQTSTCGKYREKTVLNPAGYRARAGYIDSAGDSLEWRVNGAHQEILEDGSLVKTTSFASDCNLAWDQWL